MKTSTALFLSILFAGTASAQIPSALPNAPKAVQFAGSSIVPGQANIVDIPVGDAAILRKLKEAYGKPTAKVKAFLAVPVGFDPSQVYPLVIETATTDGKASSVEGAGRFLQPVLAKGCILLAVDGEFGKPTGPGDADSVSFRWALNEAALKQLQKDWPASKTWPIITAGTSGGAGYASFNAIKLVDEHYPIIGMFLANSGWNPTNFAAELNRAPSAAMRKVPVFMTAGTADTIATKQITEQSRDAVQKERFKNVRYETFNGGHQLSAPLLESAIDWFLELSKNKGP